MVEMMQNMDMNIQYDKNNIYFTGLIVNNQFPMNQLGHQKEFVMENISVFIEQYIT